MFVSRFNGNIVEARIGVLVNGQLQLLLVGTLWPYCACQVWHLADGATPLQSCEYRGRDLLRLIELEHVICVCDILAYCWNLTSVVYLISTGLHSALILEIVLKTLVTTSNSCAASDLAAASQLRGVRISFRCLLETARTSAWNLLVI
jgi:hypothetical protein